MNDYSWIKNYADKPFKDGAYGPDAFDCYGLLWDVSKEIADIELPRFDLPSHQVGRIVRAIKDQKNTDDWIEQKKPSEFCAVGMARATDVFHVGIYLNVDGGKVMHTGKTTGVLFTNLGALRRMGFQTIQFYSYANS